MANDILQKAVHVTDDDALCVLQMWYFACNITRQNVMPTEMNYVHSESLGIVRSRDARLCVTRNTLKYSAVFTLLCKWLRDHQPNGMRDFPFTTITMNYDYAARIHRDSDSSGPSMTHAFGTFRGGQLLYWPDDDAHQSLDQLKLSNATTIDTQQSLVLFDGLRAHAVSTFLGERYSLVWFTINQYHKAPQKAINHLLALGIQWPTSHSIRHFEKSLRPPKGYGAMSHSILKYMGKHEQTPMCEWRMRNIFTLHDVVIEFILSYMIEPIAVSIISSVSRRFNKAVRSKECWRDVIIDARQIRPVGKLAYKLYTRWASAHVIFVARWQLEHIGLLISDRYVAWRWREPCGTPYQALSGKTILVSQTKVPRVFDLFFTAEIRGTVTVGISSSHDLRRIVFAADEGHANITYYSAKCDGLIGKHSFCFDIESNDDVVLLSQSYDRFYVTVVCENRPVGEIIPCWTKL